LTARSAASPQLWAQENYSGSRTNGDRRDGEIARDQSADAANSRTMGKSFTPQGGIERGVLVPRDEGD